jgi:hypothetical protein
MPTITLTSKAIRYIYPRYIHANATTTPAVKASTASQLSNSFSVIYLCQLLILLIYQKLYRVNNTVGTRIIRPRYSLVALVRWRHLERRAGSKQHH